MYKIKYLKEALEDLSEIQLYISKDNLVSSIKVLAKIKETIEFLKIFPKIGVLNNGNVRKIIEPKYNFTIFYKIKENNIIEIIAIFKYKNFSF